jgi:hypothetical protein
MMDSIEWNYAGHCINHSTGSRQQLARCLIGIHEYHTLGPDFPIDQVTLGLVVSELRLVESVYAHSNDAVTVVTDNQEDIFPRLVQSLDFDQFFSSGLVDVVHVIFP